MDKIKFIPCIIFFVALAGCRSYRLSEKEIVFNPYKVGDTLVFKSNSGVRDTIFIVQIMQRKNPTDPLALFPKYAEHLSVMVKHSDPALINSHRYFRGSFLDIHKWNKKTATIDFNLTAKGAWFYSTGGISLAAVKKEKMNVLKIDSMIYTDVVIMHSDYTEYRNRNNFIYTIYWSHSMGYLKFDLLNGTTWALEQRFRKNSN